jgi:hypothetical protein
MTARPTGARLTVGGRLARLAQGIAAAFLAAIMLVVGAIVFPQPMFAYHVTAGRLSLWSDRPFDLDKGQAILAQVEMRLATSPLDDDKRHAIFVTNTAWRRSLFFLIAEGAAGVNNYPLTNNVFIRQADIGADRVFGASGKPAPPPRTLAYYATHEITHSLTGEHLGVGRLWNRKLPQWVREGYADYVGMGGQVDVDDLYRRYRAGDPDLDFTRSHTYARFRLLTAYRLEREHWSVDQLLASRLSQSQAEAKMVGGMERATAP